MIFLLLALSIVLATTRNIMSKDIADINIGAKEFFLLQAVIFIGGGAFICVLDFPSESAADDTIYYALVYGILLIAAQYCYTFALKSGKVGICSIVYSLGFVLPTLSGSLFWGEPINVYNVIGITLIIPMIVICGRRNPQDAESENNRFLVPLIAAMIASGGLGIMQKVQQCSKYSTQKNIFLIVAFALAGAISLFLYPFGQKTVQKLSYKKLGSAAVIGAVFALSNLCNTILSGELKTAIFYPMLNICTILFSVVSGIILYKEKWSKKDATVLLFGATAIILISIS